MVQGGKGIRDEDCLECSSIRPRRGPGPEEALNECRDVTKERNAHLQKSWAAREAEGRERGRTAMVKDSVDPSGRSSLP